MKKKTMPQKAMARALDQWGPQIAIAALMSYFERNQIHGYRNNDLIGTRYNGRALDLTLQYRRGLDKLDGRKALQNISVEVAPWTKVRIFRRLWTYHRPPCSLCLGSTPDSPSRGGRETRGDRACALLLLKLAGS